ncbi:MAG: tetratricopeptide repeat protein [Burkholderiales bacterium]|nr:tetratricopeptide repeat protein [Burkholderiales bacterium]
MNTATAITLVAVDCAYPELAAKALARSARALPVARTLLLTDRDLAHRGVEVQRIAPIRSRAAYSQFMLKSLAPFIATSHALVVQWDGFVIDGSAWADEFWHYDYIGARWPHVAGDFRVGNGGFSLRSKRLLDALADDAITLGEDNEDEAICIRHRELLERKYRVAFASERVADRFAFDVGRPVGPTLGFHGVFNFWQVMSDEELITFSRTAPEAIAEGLGFGALCRNLVDLKRIAVAREFVTRRLASLPQDVTGLDLRERLRALETPNTPATPATASDSGTIKPPASRNSPCPCGSGKRYKDCHGKIAPSPATAVGAGALNVDAVLQEALQWHQGGQIDAAVDRYARVLQVEPENPTALHFAGLSQYQQGQPSAALELMWRSVRLADQEPEFFSNISAAAWNAGRYDEGRWAAERALALNAEHVGALNNLGFNLRSLNDIDGSIAAFDRALTLAPQFDYARWNRTFSLLAKGDYAQGFADYELRLRFPQTQPGGKIPAATLWRGEAPAPGSHPSILLLCEQGLGDTFMFARFVPWVAGRGLVVTLAVPRSQVALMQQSFPGIRVIAVGEHEAMTFDYWAALWSLPAALGVTLDNLPAPNRFLQTQPEAVARWRQRLDSLAPLSNEGADAASTRALRIGLVWQGQFAGQDNQMADRSVPPRLIRQFVEAHPEHRWVSLQHGAAALGASNIVDWTAETVEFTQMAALIDALDLVISIDTGAAHLAAALGARTWVALREAGDWRYGISGDRCAWSPTMRLFRQDRSRRWEPVLAQLSAALGSTR